MNRRFIEWIWHIRGSVPLAPNQSSNDAFDKLDPLFREPGTEYERTEGRLVFSKKDQAAQDKMSVFDGGVLQVENGPAGPVMRYHLISRALLYCFIAPFMFLAFAQFTIFVGQYQQPTSNEAAKELKKDLERPQHWIDKALGAPAPDKPKTDDKKEDENKDKPSPTPAYVFAGIFAALYVGGRILEDRLINLVFRRRLRGSITPVEADRDRMTLAG